MQFRSRLVAGLAAVFAGLTTLLVVASAATRSPFALLAALPLWVTATVMWYQATGRLEERARRSRARGGGFRSGRRRSGPGPGAEGVGGGVAGSWFVDDAGRRWYVDGTGRRWSVGPAGRRADAAGGSGPRQGGRRGQSVDGPSTREAYRVLGLEPGADDAAVRAAYRQKVKAVHPDAEDGDAEAFKRLTAAYERLTG